MKQVCNPDHRKKQSKPQKISIKVDTRSADKIICVGILTSAHKRVYIEANGEVEQLFETSDKEFIRSVFIENTDVDTVKISGIATMLSDSEQNAAIENQNPYRILFNLSRNMSPLYTAIENKNCNFYKKSLYCNKRYSDFFVKIFI